jgi:hypothetical protein
MTTATINNCTPPSGHCSFRYLTEASDLCIPPGRWPETIDTTLGNGLPFVAHSRDDHGAVLYKQQFGCVELLVLND